MSAAEGEPGLSKIIHSGVSAWPNDDTGRRVPPQSDSVLLAEEPHYNKSLPLMFISPFNLSTVPAIHYATKFSPFSGRKYVSCQFDRPCL